MGVSTGQATPGFRVRKRQRRPLRPESLRHPMGIVAFCPNGHRIKVKDEFAGRKGICPQCAVRFRIPARDAAGVDAGMELGAAGVASGAIPTARVVSQDPRYVASLPVAQAFAAVTVAEAAATADGPDVEVDFVAVAEEAVAADAQPTHAALADRPDLPWYVAARGGAPSGPLDADTLRNWLDSGSASGDHVVWRQGWPDWIPLGDVFPEVLPPEPRGWP